MIFISDLRELYIVFVLASFRTPTVKSNRTRRPGGEEDGEDSAGRGADEDAGGDGGGGIHGEGDDVGISCNSASTPDPKWKFAPLS